MANEKDTVKDNASEGEEKSSSTTEQQEKTDPQKTELRGFFNSSEDLEPTLTDGKKSPDKAKEGSDKE